MERRLPPRVNIYFEGRINERYREEVQRSELPSLVLGEESRTSPSTDYFDILK